MSLRRRSPRQQFDVARETAIALTLLAGAAVGMAASIPTSIRLPLLALLLSIWVVAILLASATGLRVALRPATGRGRLFTWIGLAALGTALLGAAQHELVRLLPGTESLTWLVDNRFLLALTQTVSRRGDIASSLDFAGAPVAYHLGPAWLAGAGAAVAPLRPGFLLFGIIVPASLLALVLGVHRLLERSRMSARSAAAATGLALLLPSVALGTPPDLITLALRAPDVLFNMELWTFALPATGLFALAVAFGSIAWLLDERSSTGHLALAALGVSSLIQLKPQYFLGAGLLIGAAALVRLAGLSGSRDRRLLLAAMAALALALLQRWILPGFVNLFEGPHWVPGHTYYSGRFVKGELLRVQTLVALLAAGIAAGALLSATKVARPALARFVEPGLALPALAMLVGFWYLVEFPMDPALVGRSEAVGLTRPNRVQQFNLYQSTVPLRIIVAVTATGVILRCFELLWSRRARAALLGIATLLLVAPLPHLIRGFARPGTGWEAASVPELDRVLAAVPRDGEVLLASDLADPADDYWRHQNNSLYAALHGHQTYLSNLRFVHWLWPDTADRLRAMRAFFGSRWSPWHEAWLREAGITHVVINDRCRPVWWPARGGLPMREVAADGRWTVYAVGPLTEPGDGFGRPPDWEDLSPAYGRAGCVVPHSMQRAPSDP